MPYKVDFKKLATEIDIGNVAQLLKLQVVKHRATCPVCDSERSIQLFAETNSFRCHKAEISGDCIALYAHVNEMGMYKSALALQEQFGTAHAARKVQAPAPQRPEGRTAKSQPAPTKPYAKAAKPMHEFDPDEYASKLQYTPELEALGISEDDAARFGIGFASTGFHRGSVVIAIRHPNGEIAGFAGIKDGVLKLPSKWLAPKVVEFKKRA